MNDRPTERSNEWNSIQIAKKKRTAVTTATTAEQQWKKADPHTGTYTYAFGAVFNVARVQNRAPKRCPLLSNSNNTSFKQHAYYTLYISLNTDGSIHRYIYIASFALALSVSLCPASDLSLCFVLSQISV